MELQSSIQNANGVRYNKCSCCNQQGHTVNSCNTPEINICHNKIMERISAIENPTLQQIERIINQVKNEFGDVTKNITTGLGGKFLLPSAWGVRGKMIALNRIYKKINENRINGVTSIYRLIACQMKNEIEYILNNVNRQCNYDETTVQNMLLDRRGIKKEENVQLTKTEHFRQQRDLMKRRHKEEKRRKSIEEFKEIGRLLEQYKLFVSREIDNDIDGIINNDLVQEVIFIKENALKRATNRYRNTLLRLKEERDKKREDLDFDVDVSEFEMSDNECLICYEEINHSNCIMTKCEHKYCFDCFKKVMAISVNEEKTPTCSMCRRQIKEMFIHEDFKFMNELY